jgi:hypothetical protein
MELIMTKPKTIHFDGPCPFLTCLEPGPHDHEVCPTCQTVRYGNLYCNTCRERINDARGWNLPMFTQKELDEMKMHLAAQQLEQRGLEVQLIQPENRCPLLVVNNRQQEEVTCQSSK